MPPGPSGDACSSWSALLRTIRQHDRGFHLLAGDFNTLAPGDVFDFRKLPTRLRALVWLSGGRIRWRTIEMVLNAGYVDAFRKLHPDDRGLTFPVWDPHVRLDYVFASAGHAERLLTCEVVRQPTGRPRRPITFRSLPRSPESARY